MGYRLCCRSLGPEEWMLGCSHAFLLICLGPDMEQICVAFWMPLVTAGVRFEASVQFGHTLFSDSLFGIPV